MAAGALGLQEVAEELGVHYQTAYRWVRSGRLPSALVERIPMAAAALRDANWHVHHLGAGVPGADLMGFIDAQPVDLVVPTVTAPGVRPAVDGVVAQLEAAGRSVPVGDAGASLDELQRSARGD